MRRRIFCCNNRVLALRRRDGALLSSSLLPIFYCNNRVLALRSRDGALLSISLRPRPSVSSASLLVTLRSSEDFFGAPLTLPTHQSQRQAENYTGLSKQQRLSNANANKYEQVRRNTNSSGNNTCTGSSTCYSSATCYGSWNGSLHM